MGKKIKGRLSRAELADHLADLSRQMRNGRLEIEGHSWTVPESLEVRIQLKEEDGEVVGKLSWQWPTLRTSEVQRPESREAASQKPASFKEVKTRMAAAFKELQRLLGEEQFPGDHELSDFVEDSRLFAAMAPPEWLEPVMEFLAHLEEFQGAVADRRLKTAEQRLQVLRDAMIICHRKFRK